MRPRVDLAASVMRRAQKNMTRHTITVRKTRTMADGKHITMIIRDFLEHNPDAVSLGGT
jgi:hypothetical protein